MEHKFEIPSKLLMADIFKKETGFDLFILDNDLILAGDCTREEAEAALSAHNPPEPTPPTLAEKLASVGLSLEELKAALS
jgi:hypothetical protein